MASKPQRNKPKDDNPDPITGEPGSHPVGTGVGAAVGAGVGGAAIGAGAAASAAALGGTVGAVAGPVGVAVGAIAGGVAGAFAGKGIAESIDPTAEDAYWRHEFENRPYYEQGNQYDDYKPAYQYGWESRAAYAGRTYDEVEGDLERIWQERKADLEWEKARPAVRDAWDRIDRSQPKKS